MRRYSLYGLALLILASLLVRLPDLWRVLDYKGAFIIDPDSCYHFFLVKWTMEQYPRVPHFDPGLAYPLGSNIPWPPLFELSAATFAMPAKILCGDFAADVFLLFFIPLLASLSVIPFYFLVRRDKSVFRTWCSLAFFVILSMTLYVGLLGNLDQDAAILFVNIFMCIAFLRTLERGRPYGLALSTAALMLVWAGSIIYLVPIGLTCVYLRLSCPGRDPLEKCRGKIRMVGLGLMLAAALYQLGIIIWGPGGWWKPSYIFPGIFQAQELFLVGISLLILDLPRSPVVGMGAALAAGLIGLFVMPGMWSNITGGMHFFSKDNIWLTTIDEYQPLIGLAKSSIKDDLARIMSRTGYLLFLLPAAIAARLMSKAGGNDKRQTPLTALTISSLLIYLIYSENQIRYFHQLAPWLAVCATWLVDFLTDLRLLKIWSKKLLSRFRKNNTWIALDDRKDLSNKNLGMKKIAASIILVCLLLYPCATKWFVDYENEMETIFHPAVEAARWLAGYAKDHPDRTGKSLSGVMVRWDRGHIFHYYAGLPEVADGFGNTLPDNGLLDSARFYLTSSLEEAMEILKRRRVRYVVVIQPGEEINHEAVLLGEKPEKFFERNHRTDGSQYLIPGPGFYQTMTARLYYRQWNPGYPPLPQMFKLIYPAWAQGINTNINPIPVLIYEYMDFPGDRGK